MQNRPERVSWKFLISSYFWLPDSVIYSTITHLWPLRKYWNGTQHLVLLIITALHINYMEPLWLAWHCTIAPQPFSLVAYTSSNWVQLLYLLVFLLQQGDVACLLLSAYLQHYTFRVPALLESFSDVRILSCKTADWYCNWLHAV